MNRTSYFNGYSSNPKSKYFYCKEIPLKINTNLLNKKVLDFDTYKNNIDGYFDIGVQNNSAVCFGILNLEFESKNIFINNIPVKLEPKKWNKIIVLNRGNYYIVNNQKTNKSFEADLTIKIKGFSFVVFNLKAITDFVMSSDKEVIDSFKSIFQNIIQSNRNQNNESNQKNIVYGNNNNIKITNIDKTDVCVNNFNKIDVKGLTYKKDSTTFNATKKCNIDLGNHNNVTLTNISSVGNIQVYGYKNNYIKCDSVYLNEYCLFINNNNLTNVDLSVKNPIVLFSDNSTLKVKTKIIDKSAEKDNFIVVENTEGILKGNTIGFMSSKKAFIYRKVYSVIENKVYFEEPLHKNEDSFIDGIVFSDVPDEFDGFTTKTKTKTKKYERRFYIQTLPKESLYLKDVRIGDFKTKISYIDESTKLMITSDIANNTINENTDIVVEEYKYKNSVKFIIGDFVPNVYIGQKITIKNKDYTVKGFNSDSKKILFEETEENFAGEIGITSDVKQNEIVKINNIEIFPIHFKMYDPITLMGSNEKIYNGETYFIYYNSKKINIKSITEVLNNGDNYKYLYKIEFVDSLIDVFINNTNIINNTFFKNKEKK